VKEKRSSRRSLLRYFIRRFLFPELLVLFQPWLKKYFRQVEKSRRDVFSFKLKDSVSFALGERYTLLEKDSPFFWWLFFDFASARPGDIFIIEVFSKIEDWQLYERFEVSGFQSAPILLIGDRFLPAIRVEVVQKAGVAKKVMFSFFGRAIEESKQN